MRTLLALRSLSAVVVALVCIATASTARADKKMPLVFSDDFEQGADRWEPTDPKAWKVVELDGNNVYSLFGKSDYKPPHRSPFNFSLVRAVNVGDFEFNARMLSTKPDYNHRDMCAVFGYQDPAHFYYVHLGKKTDDHANQIFIVNDAARVKISTETTPGTDWDDEWHKLRIKRDVKSGSIEIYYDDMQKPVMRAVDKTFTWGRVGVGSFDDIGDWDDVKLYGEKVQPK